MFWSCQIVPEGVIWWSWEFSFFSSTGAVSLIFSIATTLSNPRSTSFSFTFLSSCCGTYEHDSTRTVSVQLKHCRWMTVVFRLFLWLSRKHQSSQRVVSYREARNPCWLSLVYEICYSVWYICIMVKTHRHAWAEIADRRLLITFEFWKLKGTCEKLSLLKCASNFFFWVNKLMVALEMHQSRSSLFTFQLRLIPWWAYAVFFNTSERIFCKNLRLTKRPIKIMITGSSA